MASYFIQKKVYRVSPSRSFPLPSQSRFAPPPPPPPPSLPSQSRQNWGYGVNDGSSYTHRNIPLSPPPRNPYPPPPPPPPPSDSLCPYPPPPPSSPPPPSQPPCPPPMRNRYPPPPPADSLYPPPPSSPRPPSQPPCPPPMRNRYPPPPSPPVDSLYPPPPPVDSSYPPPPLPPSCPPPPSQPRFPPPPLPSCPPPHSQPRFPWPPPSSVPPLNQPYESSPSAEKRRESGWRGSLHGNQAVRFKQPGHSLPPLPVENSNAPSGRVETEEERRLRKKRELEKQRHRQQLRESQNRILEKTKKLASGMKVHGSISASHMSDRRISPLLSGGMAENRLKKPSTFLCKLKFRNELPDPTAQLKILKLRRDSDRFMKYSITSLEKTHKPQLYVEPDLGIPLDLLDLSVYNPPKGVKIPLAPEDEELLHDDDPITPIKKDGIKKKERPTDKGLSWLVKTQYISPLSTESSKQSLTEKQAKELRETRGGRNILENLNNRDGQIQEIEASFEACKSWPIHATNRGLQPVKVQPLVPDFDRYKDQFVLANFDCAPTTGSETYNKLDKTVRDAYESQAIMKRFVASSSDADKPDKFLAYMVPAPNEISKNVYVENEDISYSLVREYHWDVRGDDADDPTTYVVTFGGTEAHYMPVPTKLVLRKKIAREAKSKVEVEHFPDASRVTVRKRPTVTAIEEEGPLPTKLVLRKKRATEGKSNDEVEHFPVPSRVTVRKRPTVAAIELKEEGGYTTALKGECFKFKENKNQS